jgi:hypothetical protein
MMGVLLTAPPPFMSEDKLPTSEIQDADREDIEADLPFPAVVSAREDWLGVAPLPDQEPAAQWEAVRATWEVPDWDKTPVEPRWRHRWRSGPSWPRGPRPLVGTWRWPGWPRCHHC